MSRGPIALCLAALTGLLMTGTAQAAAPALTKARSVAKVRAAVQRNAPTARIQRVSCATPRRGRTTCRVVFTTRTRACTDAAVSVLRGRTRLLVRGLRSTCRALPQPVQPAPAPAPDTSAPPPAPAPPAPPADTAESDPPSGDENVRKAILNPDGSVTIYTWSPYLTDCALNPDGSVAYYVRTEAATGRSWYETFCNFDMIDNFSGLRVGRGTYYYYYAVTKLFEPYSMCYPGARELIDALNGVRVLCDPPVRPVNV